MGLKEISALRPRLAELCKGLSPKKQREMLDILHAVVNEFGGLAREEVEQELQDPHMRTEEGDPIPGYPQAGRLIAGIQTLERELISIIRLMPVRLGLQIQTEKDR
jgi:hypothetical protein